MLNKIDIPYVIAEAGSNHNGDFKTAIKLIDMAALAGASAIKFQKRDNPTLFTDEMYHSPYDGYGLTYGTHRAALDFNFEQFMGLKDYADSKDIDFLVTPFDVKSVDFLESLGVTQYKIASASVTNRILLDRIAKTDKPVFMSAGGQSLINIRIAGGRFPAYNWTLLHCVAAYPCPPELMNLGRITEFKKEFPKTRIGLSDHQDGIALGAAAYALGARVFEKHITLDHSAKGTDHSFSLEYFGLQQYVKYLNDTAKALIWHDQPMEREIAPILKMSQSLYWAKYVNAGVKITAEDIAIQSPGHSDGLYPTQSIVDKFIGGTLRTQVFRGGLLSWENLL